MVYDVSERQSFENIKLWNQEIDKKASPNVARILVANKNDMKQVVTTKEGQVFLFLSLLSFESFVHTQKRIWQTNFMSLLWKFQQKLERVRVKHLMNSLV